MNKYLCDYWLPTRAKCGEPATVHAVDEYAAPLRFCDKHWRRAAVLRTQYGKLQITALGNALP